MRHNSQGGGSRATSYSIRASHLPTPAAALALVGNKTDLWEQREVSEEEGQAYADK